MRSQFDHYVELWPKQKMYQNLRYARKLTPRPLVPTSDSRTKQRAPGGKCEEVETESPKAWRIFLINLLLVIESAHEIILFY
jgi:hypothetical protein